MRLRTAEARVVAALYRYAAETFGDAFIDQAWDEFVVWDEDDNSDAGDDRYDREYDTTFLPWLVFSFVPDAAEGALPPDWPSQPVARHFLESAGRGVADLDRRVMLAACASPVSFLVVESVTPGRDVRLRDLLTGWRCRVLEQSASRTFKPHDMTFARVVTLDGVSILIGASPTVIGPDHQLEVIKLRERARPGALMTKADLDDWDIEIRDLYHDIVFSLWHPPEMVLRNTDGEPLALTTLTYTLQSSLDNAFERLLPLATIDDGEHLGDVERDPAGRITSATLSWMQVGNSRHKDWRNTVLGRIEIGTGRIVAEVNSAARADRLHAEIVNRFGDAATLIERKAADLRDELERRASERAAGTLADPPRESSPELRAIEEELETQHWNAWLDEPVPALGDITPREAARTSVGRERLGALLAGFERQDARRSGAVRHVLKLRRELGLD